MITDQIGWHDVLLTLLIGKVIPFTVVSAIDTVNLMAENHGKCTSDASILQNFLEWDGQASRLPDPTP